MALGCRILLHQAVIEECLAALPCVAKNVGPSKEVRFSRINCHVEWLTKLFKIVNDFKRFPEGYVRVVRSLEDKKGANQLVEMLHRSRSVVQLGVCHWRLTEPPNDHAPRGIGIPVAHTSYVDRAAKERRVGDHGLKCHEPAVA